jgi:hypothetical protein
MLVSANGLKFEANFDKSHANWKGEAVIKRRHMTMVALIYVK